MRCRRERALAVMFAAYLVRGRGAGLVLALEGLARAELRVERREQAQEVRQHALIDSVGCICDQERRAVLVGHATECRTAGMLACLMNPP